MEIGSKIRSLRLTHDMTLEDLANRTELTKGFLSQLERDLTSPSIATLVGGNGADILPVNQDLAAGRRVKAGD